MNPAATETAPAQTARSTPSSRVPYLDGLRGFAAFLVMFFHTWGIAGAARFPISIAGHTYEMAALIEPMNGSRVSIFFFLSGLVLFLPFVRSADAWGKHSFPEFLRRRLVRLTPPYWVGLLVSSMMIIGPAGCLAQIRGLLAGDRPPLAGPYPHLFDGFPIHLVYMQGLLPGFPPVGFNPVYWTMTCEVQFYLTFPLLAFVAHRFGALKAIALAIGTSLLFRWIVWHEIGSVLFQLPGIDRSGYFNTLCASFLGRWCEFGFGMAAALWIARGHALRPAPALTLLSLGIALAAWMRLRHGMYYAFTDASVGLACLLLVIGCTSVGWLARLFSTRPLLWLGTISYSLYLIHFPVLLMAQRRLIDLGWAGPERSFVELLPVALLGGWLFWRWVEQPLIARFAAPTRRAPA
jgi:peptidoglycan/LPS O-acetylase OafA/YrhL